MRWNISFSYLSLPMYLKGGEEVIKDHIDVENTADLIKKVEEIAFARQPGYLPLRVEEFTDEIHFFFRDRRGKTRRFMNCQIGE